MSDEDVDFTKIRNGFQKAVEDDFAEETGSSGDQDVFILVKFEKDHCKQMGKDMLIYLRL